MTYKRNILMSEKLLDYNEALERLGGDEEFLTELLYELIGQVNENVIKIKEAIHSKNHENLKSLAHSLKGASANLNVTRMATHFFNLEALAESQSVEGAENLLELAVQDKIELEQFLKRETLKE